MPTPIMHRRGSIQAEVAPLAIDPVSASSHHTRQAPNSADLLATPKPRGKEEQVGIQVDGVDVMLTTMLEKHVTAQQHQVDVAKMGFIRSIARLGAALVVTGIALTLTALSGGAGIPFAALAGASLLLATGDAICAYRDWQLKKGGVPGLPFGGNCLANLLSRLADLLCALAGKVRAKDQVLNDNIHDVIVAIDLTIRFGIGLSMVALSFSPQFANVPVADPFNAVLGWTGKISAVLQIQVEKIFTMIYEKGYARARQAWQEALQCHQADLLRQQQRMRPHSV